MSTDKILIVEDDKNISKLVVLTLRDVGMTCDIAENGEEGLARALSENYSLIILDIMLPKLDGLEVCKRIRAARNNVLIIMLTSRAEEIDRVLGLECGADDYLTKPFSVRELIARVKALRRRMPGSEQLSSNAPVKVGLVEIDIDKRRVTKEQVAVELTAKEFDLLLFLATSKGRVFSREQLLDKVWGYQSTAYEHTVTSHINRLRSKLEQNPDAPQLILTVRGVGYQYSEKD